jgi:hypothetical protein
MAEPQQNFANHAQMVPGYHYVTGAFVLAYLVWSIARLVTAFSADTAYALVGALALFGVYAYTRLFPLKAQDRVIRLEERLRLARLLPADLQPRIEQIAPRHLIALRFASDAELPELARAVLDDPSITPKQVKAKIRSWRADHFRV